MVLSTHPGGRCEANKGDKERDNLEVIKAMDFFDSVR